MGEKFLHSVYYNSLGANKRVYDEALHCFQNRGRGFSLGGVAQAEVLVSQVLGDHPELFYVSQGVGIAMTFLSRTAIPKYLYSQAEAARLRQELDAAADRIIRQVINDHQSDYDKVLQLHDYLKQNVEYDYNAARSMMVTDPKVAAAHNIVGALLKGKCVCEGFAKAMKFLCDRIGLECWVVSGKGSSSMASGPHAWNIVRINGYYHHVDVTWDIQAVEEASIPNYGYLNLSDQEIAKDHTWDKRLYPACPDSPYNYFRVNNALLDSRAQLESMLYNSLQMEEEYIMFRVVRGSLLEREINGCLTECIQRAISRCKYVKVPTFHYNSVPEQLTFCVKPDYEW